MLIYFEWRNTENRIFEITLPCIYWTGMVVYLA